MVLGKALLLEIKLKMHLCGKSNVPIVVDLKIENLKKMLNENFQSLKKIFFTALRKNGLFNLSLVGKTYKVCYEAAHYKGDRDYPVIKFLAKDRKCIFDIGANVGTSTLLLAEDNTAVIHAFEASEFASKIVLQNMAANGLENRVKVINTLVADKSGAIIPFYWAYSSGGASIFKGRLGHDFAINKIALALDDYISTYGLYPDLLKIDVEGAELMVLNGALNMLRKIKPLIFLELHALGEMPLWQNAIQIIEVLKTCDYKMIYLRTKEEVIDAALLKGRGRCHVLLMPKNVRPDDILGQLDTSKL